ncbi:MAG TPA: HlyD family secretion protein [Candidatus Udaeobacter sp.]|jgi:membrane fusion protein (multidrug efflux system)|nr:HlyD family secretion protein [Candidatus Udaeobacter sp.]
MSTAASAPAAAPASAPSIAAVPAPPARKRPVAPIVAGVVVLGLLLFFGRQWLMARGFVSTDNAQVAGHVIPVLPRISGYVTAVNVRENQQVKAGDVLVQIDERDLRVRLEQAQADLEKELANAGTPGREGQATAEMAAARATLAQARANADRARQDLERFGPLAARGVVSQQQLDAARAASIGAAAQVTAAEDRVVAAGAARTGATAKVASTRAARDQAALQLSYTTLTAPASGVVSKKNVEIGELVQVGQPLLTVVPLDDVWIVANLKETEIRGVSIGAPAEIEVDSYKGVKFRGHVESLSPATGATFSMLPPDNATGNFTKVVQRIPVRIRLDGPMDPAHPLRPGMSAMVRVRVK